MGERKVHHRAVGRACGVVNKPYTQGRSTTRIRMTDDRAQVTCTMCLQALCNGPAWIEVRRRRRVVADGRKRHGITRKGDRDPTKPRLRDFAAALERLCDAVRQRDDDLMHDALHAAEVMLDRGGYGAP